MGASSNPHPASPAMTMTDFQMADAAFKTVQATLAFPQEFLQQLAPHDLPFMTSTGKIYGPCADNAAVISEYSADWTGLATSSEGGTLRYWFFFTCEFTDARAIACLGNQPSIAAAIDSAVQHVKTNIRVWGRSGENI